MSAMTSPEDASGAFAAAITDGDVERALVCWAPDAVLVAAGARLEGHEALRPGFAQLVAARAGVEIVVADVVVAGDVATAATRMTMALPGAAEPLTTHGRVVYARQADGGWRIAIDLVG